LAVLDASCCAAVLPLHSHRLRALFEKAGFIDHQHRLGIPKLLNSWTLVGQQVPEFPSIGTTIRIPPGWTEPGAPADTTGGGTTPPTGTTTTLAGGKSTCAPGEYTILAEDTTRKKVADKLNTTVAELDAANAATPGYSSFYPGLKIKTPPKANC
jgi:hypothetical protein